MATVSHPRTHVEFSVSHPKARLWAVPVGRFLFSLIFILSGFNHFNSETIAYAANSGVPMATFLVPLSGLMIMIGGLSILLGYYARIGAALIMAFLIPVSFTMHAFWNIEDAQAAQMQMINFMKNLSLLGGAMLIAFYGSGPVSIDRRRPSV